MKATRKHATTLVAMCHPSVFGGSPLSSRHVVLRDQQQLFARARRDSLFTANTGLREQEREHRHKEGRGNRGTACVHPRCEDTTLTNHPSARPVTLSQPH